MSRSKLGALSGAEPTDFMDLALYFVLFDVTNLFVSNLTFLLLVLSIYVSVPKERVLQYSTAFGISAFMYDIEYFCCNV